MSSMPVASQTTGKTVKTLILGDVHLDTLVLPVPMKWNSGKGNWWRLRRRGGAWLLEEIIRAAIKEINDNDEVKNKGNQIEVESYNHTENGVDNPKIKSALDKEYQSSAAILGLFPKRNKNSLGDTDKVYRVERLLGWIHNDKDGVGYRDSLVKCLKPYLDKETSGRDILVFHDKARDFRYLPPDDLKGILQRHYIEGKTWIIWHMDSPLTKEDNHLWQIIKQNGEWLKRTVVIVKGECLRQAGANLPETISLEGESEKFVASMKAPPTGSALEDLALVGHLIVHFPRQGVLHAQKGRLETSCYYCPNINDQPNLRELGTMIGFTSILVAAIVRGIAWSLIFESEKTFNGIIDGIKHGVILDHLYYLHGYGDREIIEKKSDSPDPYNQLFQRYRELAETKKWKQEGMEDYRLAALPLPLQDDGTFPENWSRITGFFERRFNDHLKKMGNDEERKKAERLKKTGSQEEWKKAVAEHAETTLREIVCRGLEKVIEEEAAPAGAKPLPGTPEHTVFCPFEVHGKIKTAFRDEIDSFASIRRIIEKYLNDETWTSPLSLAVFGPPGAGKSFTISQILGTVNADITKRPLEYNVAQFTDTKDLETAFHKVQDEAVAGGVPLVFFDEFDANFGPDELGWLKFFLAPMQDGKFKAGESTYRIGRAIFVFAGGVHAEWSEFRYPHPEHKDAFKAAKGPDFISRLRGHLNIASINSPPNKGVDSILMFRRAVLLRSLLEAHLKEIFDRNTGEARIEPDLLRAFLTIPHYEHESRSMRAIIEMSRASPRGRYQKSSLPAREQLNMHVDAAEFFNRMESVKCKVTEEGIRELAYLKWEASGRPAGDGQRFWRQAEEELRQKKIVSVEKEGQIECPLTPASETQPPTAAEKPDSLREAFEQMPDKVGPVSGGGPSNPEDAPEPINQGNPQK